MENGYAIVNLDTNHSRADQTTLLLISPRGVVYQYVKSKSWRPVGS